MDSLFVVMWIFSLAFSVLFATALATYIYRSWKQIRTPDRGDDEILDHLDHVQTQLYGMSERLQRLEERLLPPADGGERRTESHEP